jgi:hypothetical protein
MAQNLRTKIYPIYSPTRGVVKNVQAPFLDPRATPDAQNVRFYDQIVEKRTGYADYGTGTITGVPIKLYTYVKEDGTEYEMLVTTTNIYYNNSGAWTSIASEIGADIDNRITMCTMYDAGNFYLCISSNDLTAHKWNGTTYNDITGATTYAPKIMLPYQFRLLMFNLTESDTNYPIKWRYCAASDFEDWSGTGSGSRNLVQGMGKEIIGAVPIKDYVGVYKDRSITILDYVGGSSIFATSVHVDGTGLLAQDAIVNLGTSHIFMGNDYNIYEWNGGWELVPIGNSVWNYIKDNINKAKKERCFAVPNFERTEAHFFFPTGSDDYAKTFVTYNWTDKSWSINSFATGYFTGAGNTYSSGVERTLLGSYISSTGGVKNYDYSSKNDGSEAISSYFTTPDVTIDKEEYKIMNKDFRNVYIDAKGNDLSMQYSSNEGSTWSTADTDTLDSTSIYNLHAYNFAKAVRNIRFKFSNNNADETYAVRFVGIEHKERERK